MKPEERKKLWLVTTLFPTEEHSRKTAKCYSESGKKQAVNERLRDIAVRAWMKDCKVEVAEFDLVHVKTEYL